MPNFKVLDKPPEIFTAKALATVALGDGLKFGANGVTPAGDGEQVDAFAMEGGSSGTYIQCGRGVMQIIGIAATGVNFAPGDDVYLNASQQLDAGSISNKAIGKVAAGEDPATAGLVVFVFDPRATVTHA